MSFTIKELKNYITTIENIPNPTDVNIVNGNLENLKIITMLFSEENENLNICLNDEKDYWGVEQIAISIEKTTIGYIQFNQNMTILSMGDITPSVNNIILGDFYNTRANPIDIMLKHTVDVLKYYVDCNKKYISKEMQTQFENVYQLVLADQLILGLQLFRTIMKEVSLAIFNRNDLPF